MEVSTINLGNVRHYASLEAAQHFTERNLSSLIESGLVFNILVVQQRRGGMGTDAEDIRYVPIINCLRVDHNVPTARNLPPVGTLAGMIARQGYMVFL